MKKDLHEQLITEILQARERVYKIGQPTPLELLPVSDRFETYIKREDLSPINAYKWRGAYNCTAILTAGKPGATVVAASAGNHAQGVALAARELGIQAKIFMPLSTPLMKQTAVKSHGGDNVEIVLEGDNYNVAGDAAKKYAKEHDLIYVHPFDDLYTIAGQATIADEIILSGKGPFDFLFVQIGGGGMAAGVATWLKVHYPDIKIIGVEGVDQASMKASLEAGKPVTLDSVDTFCDGTAVTRPGDLTFELCSRYVDEIVTVTNEEVSAAIQKMWELRRVIPEPSGAMGLAALANYTEEHPDRLADKRIGLILCGANMDFGKLTLIASNSAVGAHRKRFFRFHIGEESGGLLGLLDNIFVDVNITEFQYGKVDEKDAWPILAFEADPKKMEQIHKAFAEQNLAFEDVTGQPDVRYRIIPYSPSLFKDPVLLHVHFPERRGALRDFLKQVSEVSNICYFNYAYSGEAIGRAIMGFEFDTPENKKKFLELIEHSVVDCRPVEESTAARILEKQA